MTSKASTLRHQKKKDAAIRVAKPASKPMSDRAVYLGIVIVGFFTVALGGLVTDPAYLVHLAAAYLAIIAYLIVAATWLAYRGRHMSSLQQSLARLPLRMAGYGTRTGKPIEAAHGQPTVKTALLATVIISVAVVGGLAAWLVPGLLR